MSVFLAYSAACLTGTTSSCTVQTSREHSAHCTQSLSAQGYDSEPWHSGGGKSICKGLHFQGDLRQMLPDAFKQDVRRRYNGMHSPDLVESGVDVFEPDLVHVSSRNERRTAPTLVAIHENPAVADVLTDSLHDGVELLEGDGQVFGNGDMQVVYVPSLRLNGKFAERDDGRNALWILIR